ncbi:MAG: phage tail protein, partial [Candidatus Paceibacterota bacterium]
QIAGKPTIQKFTPIATDMFLPNHSGDHSAGHTGTPSTDLDIANKAYVDLQAVPVGTITMYGGSTAPTGWVLCDNSSLLRAGTYADLFAVIGTTFGTADGTHFNVPDMRGIFPRGAGTSAKLTNANGTAFAGVLGTYQNDKMQGHKHSVTSDAQKQGFASGILNGAFCNFQAATVTVGSPTTDGTNGTPRTGLETNPANLGLTFIIKY